MTAPTFDQVFPESHGHTAVRGEHKCEKPLVQTAVHTRKLIIDDAKNLKNARFEVRTDIVTDKCLAALQEKYVDLQKGKISDRARMVRVAVQALAIIEGVYPDMEAIPE